MDIQIEELSKIEPRELDDYLARGWFRMQQMIFTTRQIVFDSSLFETIWLRIRLEDFQPDKKYRELNKKNSSFKTEIKRAVITPQHEELFALYKRSISFETAASMRWLLSGHKSGNIYNTYMINLYDGGKMIGTGFFDLGENSAAGICSIYDPEYKKYSLGKYMIYQKILGCKNKNLRYFYPGYFVPGYPRFDYKLEIGKQAMEYFDPGKKEWIPIKDFSFSDYQYNC
jgi:arginyl-tRNA--protein-N-Asp/Glu arginylyltransferase